MTRKKKLLIFGGGGVALAVLIALNAASRSDRGTEVRLVGFGTFHVTKRRATTGRNPRTGEQIQIPASNQPKFKAGKALKDALN